MEKKNTVNACFQLFEFIYIWFCKYNFFQVWEIVLKYFFFFRFAEIVSSKWICHYSVCFNLNVIKTLSLLFLIFDQFQQGILYEVSTNFQNCKSICFLRKELNIIFFLFLKEYFFLKNKNKNKTKSNKCIAYTLIFYFFGVLNS